MSRFLVSASTHSKGEVSKIVEAVSENVTRVAAAAEGDASPSVEQSPEIAIIDGTMLLEEDEDEQSVLQTALEDKMPIIMKNASSEAMRLFAGVGVSADTVIIQPKGQGVQVDMVDDDELVERLTARPTVPSAEPKRPAEQTAPVPIAQGEASPLQVELPAVPRLMTVSAASAEWQGDGVDSLLSSTPFSGERPDLPEGAYHSFYVTQTRRTNQFEGG